jgi:hypothetical protein
MLSVNSRVPTPVKRNRSKISGQGQMGERFPVTLMSRRIERGRQEARFVPGRIEIARRVQQVGDKAISHQLVLDI